MRNEGDGNAALNAVRHDKVVMAYAEKQDKLEPADSYVMEAMISAEVIAEIRAAIESLPE